MPLISKVYQVSDEEFKQIIKNSNSYSDCLRALGLNTTGGSSTDVLKRRISELSCDTSHFGNKQQKKSPNAKYDLSEILVENSTYTNISRLKMRLIKEGILEYKCACCGINTWQNQPLALQLHHKNGINTDNRIENIELLCPNCHSLTDNYSGKNRSSKNNNQKQQYFCSDCGVEITKGSNYCRSCAAKRNNKKHRQVERPSRQELKYLIRTKSFLELSRIYGVSDNAIRKWCKYENLPYKKREIDNYSNEDWENI